MLYSTHKDYLKNFIEQSLERGQFFGEDKKYVFFNTQKRGRVANSKNWLVFPPMTPIELIDSNSKKGAKVFQVSVSGVPLVLQHRPIWPEDTTSWNSLLVLPNRLGGCTRRTNWATWVAPSSTIPLAFLGPTKNCTVSRRHQPTQGCSWLGTMFDI